MLRIAPLREGHLVGIDVARTVALVGMIATHVLDGRTTTGELTTVQWLAGGRASALFAVLAGISIALMSGGAQPVRGRTRTVLGLAARAVLVANRSAHGNRTTRCMRVCGALSPALLLALC